MKVAIRKVDDYYKLVTFSNIYPTCNIKIENLGIEEVDDVIYKCSKICLLDHKVKLLTTHIQDIIDVHKKIRFHNHKNISKINYNLGLLYFALNDCRAAKYLSLATRHNENCLLILGYYYMLNGIYDLAERFLKESIRNGNKMGMVFLGVLYRIKNIPNNYFQMAIDSDEDGSIIYKIANYYWLILDVSKAKEYYELAISKYEYKKAYTGLGSLYFDDKKYEEATKYLEIGISKGSISSLNIMANLYYNTNMKDKALEYLKLARERANLGVIIYNFGVYYSNINIDESIKYYKECMENDNVYATKSIIMLANIYKNKGDQLLMEQYSKVAANRGYIESIRCLAKYYFQNTNYEDMKIYVDMGIDQNDVQCYDIIIKYYFVADIEKMLQYYKMAFVKKINVDKFRLNQYFVQNNDLDNMKFFEDYLNTDNKKVLSKILLLSSSNREKLDEQCNICVISDVVFKTNCCHYLCVFCYSKLFKCPYCRTSLKIE